MKLIAQNPYRVLGVFADDPVRVQTANIAKIRAFAKVGKQCTFDSDHVEIFGKIDRSEEALQNALTQLSDPIEAKTWRLFWINSATDDTGIDVSTPSIQTDINGAVIAFIDYKKHKEAALHWSSVFEREIHVKTLFEETDFWESEEEKALVAKCFLDKLIPEKDSLSFEHNTIDGWFWWFRRNLSEDNCLREVLDAKYKGFAFERLEQMSKGQFTVAAYGKKYWKQLWLAKPYLRVLNTLYEADYGFFGKVNCPHDIQIAKDTFAKSLVEFCGEVYDNTTYWDASELIDMIDFIDEKVRALAFSSSTYEIMENKLKALREELKFLAPEQCKDESAKIQELIEAFCKKNDSARWSLSLVKQCVPALVSIRDKLGKENPYYRRISTKIADNAIYSADVDLTDTEQMCHDSSVDKQTSRSNLKATIDKCRLLVCNIELYDLEEAFLNGKFLSYKKRVMEVAEEYGFNQDVIVPDISMQSSADEFYACGNDYAKLREFVQTHQGDKFYDQALSMIHSIEDAAWPAELTVQNLFEYKRKFPNSHNEGKLIEALDKLLLGAANGAVADYRTMLQLFPTHPQISEIRDRIELLIYNECSTISACQEYLDTYPKGKFVQQVKEKVKDIKKNEILWRFKQCKTISDYNLFMIKYPTSELCAQAYIRIEDLRWEEVKHSGNFESYLKQYPNGRYSQEASKILAAKQAKEQEAKEYSRFNACKTQQDLKAYIKDYPKGRYVDIAKTVIRRRNRKICAYVIIAVIVVVGVVSFAISSFSSRPSGEAVTPIAASTQEEKNVGTANALQPNYDSSQTQYGDVSVYADSSSTDIETKTNPDDQWLDNRLATGSRPYSSHYGRPMSGNNEFRFKTASSCDYVILIKRSYDDRYVDHKYVRGGNTVKIKVPDGTYNVFFYSGNGWNPNKSVGACTGGFVLGESFQKDGPITMKTSIDGDYLFYQTYEYTLYPVHNGNLELKYSNQYEAFN